MDFGFFASAVLLGLGLAMDACAVSMANGLKEPSMSSGKTALIAGLFAVFQAIMPLIGWICVKTIAETFAWFGVAIPYIALLLLGFIGGKMLYEGIKHKEEEQSDCKPLTFGVLVAQAVATSIDALSTGFTIANHNLIEALVCVGIIAVVTFILSFASVFIGKKCGTKLGNKAEILGGAILIGIGIGIFVKGVFIA